MTDAVAGRGAGSGPPTDPPAAADQPEGGDPPGGPEPPAGPAPAPGFQRRVLVNTLVTGLSNGWAIVTSLVSLPFVLHGLGAPGFGRWVLLQTFSASTGWLVVLDLGLGTAATRAVARAAATEGPRATGESIGTTLGAFVALAVAGAGLAVALGWPILDHIGRTPADGVGELHLAVLLLAAQVALELVAQGLTSSLEGLQRVDLSRTVEMVRRGAWAVGTAVAATVWRRIVPVEIAMVAAAALGAVTAIVLLLRQTDATHLAWSWSRAKAMAAYAGVVVWLRPISALYQLMNQFIVAIVLGPAAVAIVEVAMQLQAGVSSVLGAASYSVLPGSAWLDARGDTDALRALLLRGTRYVVLATAPVALGVAMLARSGVALWVGHRYLGAGDPTSIAALGLALSAVSQIGAYILMGIGRGVVWVWAEAAGVVVNFGASLALVHLMGIPGVFWGTVISLGVTTPWFVQVSCRAVGVGRLEFVRRCVLPAAAPLACEAAVLGVVLALRLSPAATVVAGGLGGGAAFTLVAIRWSLHRGEARQLWSTVFSRFSASPPPPPDGAAG